MTYLITKNLKFSRHRYAKQQHHCVASLAEIVNSGVFRFHLYRNYVFRDSPTGLNIAVVILEKFFHNLANVLLVKVYRR